MAKAHIKKVCVDDHGSVFTKAVIVNSPTTAIPAHKKVKQENKLSPKTKQNLFENVDVGLHLLDVHVLYVQQFASVSV
jgi:hypothetical protein